MTPRFSRAAAIAALIAALGACTSESATPPAGSPAAPAPAPAPPRASSGREAIDAFAAAIARGDLRTAASLVDEPLGSALVRRVNAAEGLTAAVDRLTAAVDRRFGAGTAAQLGLERPAIPFPLNARLTVEAVTEKDGSGEATVLAQLSSGAQPKYTLGLASRPDGWRIVPLDTDLVAAGTSKGDATAFRHNKSASLYGTLTVQVEGGTVTLEQVKEKLAYGRTLDERINRESETLHKGLKEGLESGIK